MMKETLIGKCKTKGGISNIKYDSVLHHLCLVSLDYGVSFWRLYLYITYYFRKLEMDFANFDMEYFIFNQL